jgi:hypothetical protein
VIARVFQRSGGNPLFVEALSQSPDQLPDELNQLLLVGQGALQADTRAVGDEAGFADPGRAGNQHGLHPRHLVGAMQRRQFDRSAHERAAGGVRQGS